VIFDLKRLRHVVIQKHSLTPCSTPPGIAFSVLRSYTSAVGPALAFVTVLFIVFMQTSRSLFDFFLAHWTSSLASLPLGTRLTYLSYLAAANLLIAILRSFVFAFAGLCAAKALHMRLVSSISTAGLRFFDSRSVGVIMNRVSSDVDAVDESLPFQLNILLAQTFLLLGCVSVICISSPALLVSVPVLAAVYFYVQVQYRHASRALKRLEKLMPFSCVHFGERCLRRRCHHSRHDSSSAV
jgi:ATP-binding cassette, subfamily C (CFTR/MRP), member 10